MNGFSEAEAGGGIAGPRSFTKKPQNTRDWVFKVLGQKISLRHLLTNLHDSKNGWLTIALTTISTQVNRSLLPRYEATDIVFLPQRVRRAEMPPCCHSGVKGCRAFSKHMQWSLMSPLKGRGDRRAMHSRFPLKCYRWWLGGADTNYRRLQFTMGSILVYVYQPKTAVICHWGILGENGSNGAFIT